MTHNQKRNGGLALVAKYGRAYMAQIGRKGGLATVAKYGAGYMADIGSKGGLVAQDLYIADYGAWHRKLAETARIRRPVPGWDNRLDYPAIPAREAAP